MSSLYAPGSEDGVVWDDPDLALPWPVNRANVILSGKDEKLPRFKDFARIDW
jgi:dTDP-4-dehydrorhamnose 3,5-epimerase